MTSHPPVPCLPSLTQTQTPTHRPASKDTLHYVRDSPAPNGKHVPSSSCYRPPGRARWPGMKPAFGHGIAHQSVRAVRGGSRTAFVGGRFSLREWLSNPVRRATLYVWFSIGGRHERSPVNTGWFYAS